ncbi:hypothetical protein F6V30_08150 [Oryzomonas sagensis]|uniref:DUF2846 domain-containing protein n=1 Tax=Oryzomonas sagensis TaxID=2603857 RepID=A0ABQ6TNJ9_9BACT|nr:hypothetical protein [Oryzomonas sagensis]KAB0670125.1 hypothetical protein F6V30_08150 [Oryzomonas sagensis]
MKNHCEQSRGKRLWLVIPFILLLTACTPAHMVLKQDNFDIKTVKPTAGKAALVIARTTSFGGAVNFHTYLDQSIIGVTKGKSCIVKYDIEPGVKYLIARTESLEEAKINFEPDHIYYVQQSPRIGWVVARVTLTPLSQEQLLSEIGSDGCTLYEMDSKDMGDNLTHDEYKEAVADYERELTEGHHKDFTDYRGFAVK